MDRLLFILHAISKVFEEVGLRPDRIQMRALDMVEPVKILRDGDGKLRRVGVQREEIIALSTLSYSRGRLSVRRARSLSHFCVRCLYHGWGCCYIQSLTDTATFLFKLVVIGFGTAARNYSIK